MIIQAHSWDKTTLLITGFLGFISNELETVNLSLAIVAKLIVIGNFSIYFIVNWRRIYINLKSLLRFLKLKK